jgi:mono/diheme cytochrome c family protein
MFTMFEIFGRNKTVSNIERMKKMHKLTGRVYFIIFIFIAIFCLNFIVMTKAELSTRSAFHSLFALTILVLFGLKFLYIKIYRQFYENAKIIGLLMAIITFGLVGSSGGYYLLVSEFGTDTSFDNIVQYKKGVILAKAEETIVTKESVVQTDPESIGKGKNLFDAKCKFCHSAFSTETIVGPGLKGILERNKLPTSGRPSTAENVIQQIKKPFSRMPSFEYLTDEEIADLIAFLNTL